MSRDLWEVAWGLRLIKSLLNLVIYELYEGIILKQKNIILGSMFHSLTLNIWKQYEGLNKIFILKFFSHFIIKL